MAVGGADSSNFQLYIFIIPGFAAELDEQYPVCPSPSSSNVPVPLIYAGWAAAADWPGQCGSVHGLEWMCVSIDQSEE